MNKTWFIGCSGFHYKDWKGSFYPDRLAPSKWFEYYSTRFNSIELNVTFYRFPQLSSLQAWHRRSPDDFIFSVKAPRLITHFKKFNDCEGLLNDFYDTLQTGLQAKLGPILFQMPPTLRFNMETLDRIVGHLKSHFINVIEFRDTSWWNMAVYKKLGDHGVVFCGINHPKLPVDIIINNPVSYYRFHGSPDLYYSKYPQQTIENFAYKIHENKFVRSSFVYFNNTASSAAIQNAEELMDITKTGTRLIS